MTGNQKTNELLAKFLEEGLDSIKRVQKQNEAITSDINDLKISVNSIQQQLNSLSTSSKESKIRIERQFENMKANTNEKLKELDVKSEKSSQTVSELEKDIVAIKSDPSPQNIKRITSEITELEKRVGKVESQQSKWLGGLAALGVVIGFVFALIKEWLGPIIAG